MNKSHKDKPKHPQLFLFNITPTNIHVHEATISVPKKTPKMLEIEAEHGEDIQNLLHRKYIVDKKSTYDIEKELKCPQPTIRYWMKKFNIPIRSLKESVKDRYSICISKIEDKYNTNIRDLLYRMYIVEEKTTRAIGKDFGCHFSTVRSWMLKYGIPTRTLQEAVQISNFNHSDNMKQRWKSEKYRKKVMEAHKKAVQTEAYRRQRSDISKKMWKDKDFVQRWFNRTQSSPNKPESIITKLIPPCVVFTGHASFWRTLSNGKHSNPDWIVEPIKQTRKVIFYHGNYWHRNELHNRGQDLINQWNKIGYECLIVWEDESEEIILDKIRQFSAYQLELF